MQPETLDEPSVDSSDPQPGNSSTASQHGFPQFGVHSTPPYTHSDEYGSSHASGSEWSLSDSPGRSPTESHDAWLDSTGGTSQDRETPDETEYDDQSASKVMQAPTGVRSRKTTRSRSDTSPLFDFPEEMLFHVISHLSAADLLTVKLVSRRFYDIVNSPHAWINAFARYFPGVDALIKTADTSATDPDAIEFRSEKRVFTRLGPTASWTSEYLLRTKLLRCLTRGKPALPFAAPSPGKPNKGFATFTFTSRLRFGVSHLHAKFGPVMDKRLPQFIHGLSSHGTVSTSDRRGKFDGWGLLDRISFQEFAELHPGSAQWGSGVGDVVGIPNVMDLSSSLGMIYGEGTPGGCTYYLSTGEKNGHYLAPFLNIAKHEVSMPRVSQELNSVCSVWIAKTLAIPRITNGLIGLLTGSSNGIVSSFSAGLSSGDPQQRFEKGELTGRWLLSPGVPIIAIIADDTYTEERHADRRIWAVAVNALGEVFHLSNLPQRMVTKSHTNLQPDVLQEINAWQTGSTVTWTLVRPSQRKERLSRADMNPTPVYYPYSVWDGRQANHEEELDSLREMELWLAKRPLDIKSDFVEWDMRRRVEVDFAGDDGKGAGESVFVFDCGLEDEQPGGVQRYSRHAAFKAETQKVNEVMPVAQQQQPLTTHHSSIFNGPTWTFAVGGDSTATNVTIGGLEQRSETSSFAILPGPLSEWRTSRFVFGRFKNVKLSTTAIDMSAYAVTIASEDMTIRRARANGTNTTSKDRATSAAGDYSPFRVPGQRARFIAAGTSSGTIFVWDARAPPPGSTNVVNTIKPIRVIHTDSPDISSLALSSLYLVHGGSEGLVQAWDVLASTLEPVRTISSRTTLNARRRAVIAAQQNPAIQVQMSMTNYAATAICLDPDPTVLRGVVAIGSHLRYWSYSSEAAAEDITKSQKRKMNRIARGLNSSSGDSFAGTRRVTLRGFVSQEVAQRTLEEKEKRADEKEERRLAGRFGLDLLGEDASEEELLAYATLLSEEDHEKHIQQSMEGRLSKNASDAEIEAFMDSLSPEDLERWRYASWQERFDIPVSDASTVGRGTPTPAPASVDDVELAEAIRLSLEESQAMRASPPLSPRFSPPHMGSGSGQRLRSDARSADVEEDDVAQAIRLSLQGQAHPVQSSANGRSAAARPTPPCLEDDEDDIAKAIRLSLRDQEASSPAAQAWSPVRREQEQNDDEEFPALVASSPPSGSLASGARRHRAKGKGKGPAVWD